MIAMLQFEMWKSGGCWKSLMAKQTHAAYSKQIDVTIDAHVIEKEDFQLELRVLFGGWW